MKPRDTRLSFNWKGDIFFVISLIKRKEEGGDIIVRKNTES